MVSSKKGDVTRVLDLEGHEELKGLDGVVASVDKVAHEDVGCVRNFPALVEELQQIVELPMDVATDGDGGSDRLDIVLLDEDLLDPFAEHAQVLLVQALALFKRC